MFFKEKRHLTISSFLAKAQFKRSIKPKLTLSGDWMERAGFAVGEKITVQIFENKLIITTDGNNENRQGTQY